MIHRILALRAEAAALIIASGFVRDEHCLRLGFRDQPHPTSMHRSELVVRQQPCGSGKRDLDLPPSFVLQLTKLRLLFLAQLVMPVAMLFVVAAWTFVTYLLYK